MAKSDLVFIDDSILQQTAAAIRAKTETTENLTPLQFPEAIRSIETGAPAESITIVNARAITHLTPGNSLVVEVEIEPECASKKWTLASSNPAIVSVDVNAMGEWVVSVNAEGEVTLTATAGRVSTTLSYTVQTFRPVDPENLDLDNLSNIVKAGAASNYLSLGQELNIAYNDTTMPMRVIGFSDAIVRKDGVDVSVPAIQMEMKYCAAGTTAWGGSGSTNYSESTLKSYIEGQIQPKFSEDFVACLGETKVQFCTRSNTTDVSYCKLFAPSIIEMGGAGTPQQTAVEGLMFQYYQRSDNAMRIKQAINDTNTAQYYWTRSFNSTYAGYYDCIHISGTYSQARYDYAIHVAAACNFIGNY